MQDNIINLTSDKKWCVYLHTNKINGKRYVGITCKQPEKRWGKNGNQYKQSSYIGKAIKKYGWDNFKHEVLLTNETFEYACAVERCLIRHYKANNPVYGYNLTSGGEKSSGVIMSDEARKRMGAAQKKRLENPENHPRYGAHLTDEHKQIISNANKGRKMPKEACESMSKNRTGTKNGRTKPVYCPELNELFWGAKEAEDKYGFCRASITAVCRGRGKHCGRHPVTNELLTWKYADRQIAINCVINILDQMIAKEDNKNECA